MTTTEHGTNAAIRRHERAGEPICGDCRAERSRLQAQYYIQRRNRQAWTAALGTPAPTPPPE